MRVNRIFQSNQGEGVLAGVPMTFIRLQGCNLRCSWCDSVYAQDPSGGEAMDPVQVANIVRKLVSYQRRWLCVTGGEPLLRSEELLELIRALRRHDSYLIEIETNGSFSPPSWFSLVDSWVADIKCPSSGQCGVSRVDKWLAMRRKDQVKFVVQNAEDLDFVRKTLKSKLCVPTVLVSPAAGVFIDKAHSAIEEYWHKEWLQEVWEFCTEVNVRFSLQTHKVVWGDKLGV